MTTNFLSIDVEDYYQVSAFENIISPDSWYSFESRVEKNTRLILEVLNNHETLATFFIVGWIAKRHPDLVREIDSQGHEIGCHSYLHRKVYDLTPEEFKLDTRKSKDILEDIIGKKIKGYRAPSYSITKKSLWALDILVELGFEFDSSIFPIYHDRYGIPDAPRFEYKIPGHNLIEFPISTALFFNRKIPVSGGGYFRLFPYQFTKMALTRINKNEKNPFLFYLHPWEIDPGQPKMKRANIVSKFRHYVNLSKTFDRFIMLLNDFKFSPINTDNMVRNSTR